jgi:LAO/AO transport system kinase
MRKNLLLKDYLEGFKLNDRTILARAITLIESSHPDHQKLSAELLKSLLPQTGRARRIGISGTPGVGKSTFIEIFGKLLTTQNKKVAVLTVDPTSQVSGGSILGDKTRMNELAIDPNAFIRPTPSGDTLGGVAKKTRETLLLCEAFGFDYVLVETVGVGQSETQVAKMTDIFIMLLQPGSGDDLQGIKRGILELVDMVVVTKDDGDQTKMIERAKHDYQKALEILRHETKVPPVLSSSSLTKKGYSEIEKYLENYFTHEKELIIQKRNHQNLQWMWDLVYQGLLGSFKEKITPNEIHLMEEDILKKKITPVEAASKLLSHFLSPHLPKKL